MERTADQALMIVKVYLSNHPDTAAEVPITPATTCQDVIAMCKEAGEVKCHLAELWRDCERPIGEHEHIYDILQQWGVHRNEVKFFLRHESANMDDADKDQGHKPKKKNGLKGGGGIIDDYRFPPNVDLSLTDLQDMATRQQQQIETQQQMLVAKQQRLKFLKQQETKHQQITQENERLHRLRDKVEMQEQKLRKLRALRGNVGTTKATNNNLSGELDTVRGLFAEKEKELLVAVAKVEELSHQLEELKKGNLNGLNGGPVYQMPATLQLDKLRQELLRRNKLNEQQSITLQNQRLALSSRKDEMATIDKRIEELTEQLRHKHSLQNIHQAPSLIPNNNNNNVGLPNGTVPNQKNTPHQRPSVNSVAGTNGVNTGNRPVYTEPIKSLPNGDINHSASQKKPGPPAASKPQLMLKPQGFKPKGPNKASVSAPQGGPIAAQHPTQDEDAKQEAQNDSVVQSKPECANENSGSDTSSLTENSSVDSVPVSGLPPHPIPSSQGKPSAEKKQRSSPVLIQRGSPVQSKSSSPVPYSQQRGSPVQRGSPILQQSGSPVPAQRGSPVQRSSPVLQNQSGSMHYSRMPPVPLNDSAASSLHNRQARNRTPIYNPDDLAMLSPPAPPSPSESSSSGSHYEFDESIKSGHLFNGNVAPKGRMPSYSGPQSDSPNLNRAPVGLNQHPPSPQQKREPPPAPPRTVTLNYTGSHPPSPTRSGITQRSSSSSDSCTSNVPQTSGGNLPYNASTHPGSPLLSNGRNTSSPMTVQRGGSPSRGQPGSPSRGPSQAPLRGPHNSPIRGTLPRSGVPYSYGPTHGYGSSTQYSIAPSTNNPNAPTITQLPQDPQTNPTRPIHQRSPATVGMYIPPPNAQQRNYNNPSYQQNSGNGRPRYPRQPMKISSQNTFPALSETLPGYPTDDLDGPRPSSPTNRLPIMNLYRNIDLERFRNMPRPLKKRLSYSEDKESLNFLKPEQRSGVPFFPSESPSEHKFDNLTMDLTPNLNGNGSQTTTGNQSQLMETSLIGIGAQNGRNTPSIDVNTNTKPIISNQAIAKHVVNGAKPNQRNAIGHGQLSKPSGSGKPLSAADIGEVKGIIKRKPNGRESIRVRFDPLALLLDASLEGEFELVQRILPEVPNPSGANDEGITALHNAICASHYQIVNFLILHGVDVNSPDSDGWTPLHCAASCNNLIMVRNLVEHGAALFVTTISDKETPAEKCEEEEEGYIQCSEYLYGAQEKTGVANNGVVHALYNYEAEQPDELSFRDGDELTVLRKGDEDETYWWWARRHDKEGYIPRNLIGLFPRVKLLCR